jgi:hypothetical protein
MSNKKGDAMSINVIVIAAIALIVLVVLVAIFAGRMGLFSRDLEKRENIFCAKSAYDGLTDQEKKAAETVDGEIFPISEGCPLGKSQVYGKYKDVGAADICCK